MVHDLENAFQFVNFFILKMNGKREKNNNMNLTSAYVQLTHMDPKPRPEPIRSELRTSNEDENKSIIIIMHSVA